MLLHGSARAPSTATLCCVPKALLSLCSFIWGALQEGGFALLSLHATCVPSPQHRAWAALGLWASLGP